MTIKNNTIKKYLSDIISKEQINNWIKNKNKVGIHTTVGSGKSTLVNKRVVEVLLEMGLKGLFVSNRTLVTKQQENNQTELNKLALRMDYETTQSMIQKYKTGNILPVVDLVIIDEYHQLVTDSAFNNTISLFLEIVEKLNVPVIFISATPPKNIFGIDTIINDNDLGIKQHIYNNAKVYHHIDEIESVLENIINNTNDKVLFYINNSNKIRSLHLQYKDISMVYSSRSNTILQEFIVEDKVDNLINNQKFSDRILFTTKVIDSGVNILDEDLKHIIVFSYDVEEVLQVVGRKRDNKDELNIYLKNYNPKELGGYKSNIVYKLSIIEDFKKNPLQTIRSLTGTKEEYLLNELFTYDETLRKVINTTVEENLRREYELLERISENTYTKELEKVNIFAEDKTYKKDWNELEDYLKELYDNKTVFLNRDSRESLIDKINYRENGELKKSIGKLNGFLKERKSRYRIEQFRTERYENGKRKQYRSAWKVIKID